MNNSTSKHAAFIRAIMGKPTIARDYFRTCFPTHVIGRLDFSTLTRLPDTYVPEELYETISDIVYSCQRMDRKDDVKISLLISHGNYLDNHTSILIGSYLFSGLAKQSNNGLRPSLIIPVLLYHGKESRKDPSQKSLFSEMDADLSEFVPSPEYIFHNLRDLSDDTIRENDNKFLAASLLAIKYSFSKSQLKQMIPNILSLSSAQKDEDLQNHLIGYILESTGLEADQLIAITQNLSPKTKEAEVNTLDLFAQRGYLKGYQKGVEEAREKMVRNLIKIPDLTDELIATATDLPIDRVVSIRKETKTEE